MSEVVVAMELASAVSKLDKLRCSADAEISVPKAVIKATEANARMIRESRTSTKVSPASEASPGLLGALCPDDSGLGRRFPLLKWWRGDIMGGGVQRPPRCSPRLA